ncbi:AzlD domain-containing protein [Brevibacillus laterosporus]|uniref:AzlD domain-containing protein n=1 Tax=Brevibacillus laterosporus TaxID=1465 RepID=A0AAP8Q7W9_BRELA|nr:AzlD domain-containing protein [Brevibacillus laterosporus]ATO50892.1 branched-chain amino acid transporter AzlD [Brevibacillus laterosporus DSM 25]AYB38895.1 AzlD domain-containing protein [Brevibacillus laterosporus]MBG9774353.1 branched-chain amino acid transporter AzlD [Brevibacillus laterosporus]MBG9797857.1 branched-chain amino acid transporter AzlD [Brevibacillus laterosporus]MBG9804554.1 branched-chain amino acid transporter AzlD [Brevibacillus laterosporus]
MSLNQSILLLILGCTLVTFLPRILPFLVVRNLQLPAPVLKWLSFIPICILTALVVESVIVKTSHSIAVNWLTLIAIVPTLLLALRTKSLAITVIFGVIFMGLLRLCSTYL